jgi:uncharacterized protein YlxP (DUF503 family)
MFVCVARLTLEIPASGSLKAKRQVLRRITDRVKGRFNVSVAEVDDNDLWQRATVALAVVGNDRRHVHEQMDKIIQFVDDLYVAPMVSRQTEVLALGDQLYSDADSGSGEGGMQLAIPRGERSLAEAEGMGDWEERNTNPSALPVAAPSKPRPSRPNVPSKGGKRPLNLEEARAKARSLRNPREWEKK